MGGQRNVLQRQARGDKFVETSNYNNLIDMATQLGQLHFDPESMVMMRTDGNGTTIVNRKSTTTTTEPWTLECSLAGAVVSVTAGTISYGSVDIPVLAGDVTLTGTPEFVYVRLTRSSQATALGHASTRPASDSTYAYFVLASYTAEYGVYSLTAVHRKGDIDLQVPLQ